MAQEQQTAGTGGNSKVPRLNMMQIPRLPMLGSMATYQVIAKIKNNGRFSAVQLNHILQLLQEVDADEKAQVRTSGCKLLKLSRNKYVNKKINK